MIDNRIKIFFTLISVLLCYGILKIKYNYYFVFIPFKILNVFYFNL